MNGRSHRLGTGKRAPALLAAHRVAVLLDDVPPPRVLRLPDPPPLTIAEGDFQALVVGLAESQRWLCWHDNDPTMNGAGFPDLLLLRERLLWRELKREQGRLRPEQAAFGERLLRAGCDWAIWRPGDWDEIVATLTREV